MRIVQRFPALAGVLRQSLPAERREAEQSPANHILAQSCHQQTAAAYVVYAQSHYHIFECVAKISAATRPTFNLPKTLFRQVEIVNI